MGEAVGVVLGDGNGEDASEVGDPAEDVGERIGDPFADFGGAGAHGADAGEGGAFHASATTEKVRRHGARLVHVEVDFDAEAGGAVAEGFEIAEARLAAVAEFGEVTMGSESVQNALQPDAVYADAGELLEITVGALSAASAPGGNTSSAVGGARGC